jgi:endonuclease-3
MPQELREPRDAPVDSMGCEALVQRPPLVDPKTSRYQVLVALMLSSQTKDQTVAEAMRNLQVCLSCRYTAFTSQL